MRIIFVESFHVNEENINYNENENFIILKYDNWNDYGYYTYFHFSIWFEGKFYPISGLRILFEEETDSSKVIRGLKHEKKDNYRIIDFSLINIKFISLGASNKFYTLLKELLPIDILYDVLNSLHELSYLEKMSVIPDIELKSTEGFNDSLTRDTDSKKSIQEASHILFGDMLDEGRFNFRFDFQLKNFSKEHSISFNFNDDFFPSNIITLIGKNGSGKSQTLKHLSECLQEVGIASKEQRNNLLYSVEDAFSQTPSFSKVVIISYSPFENFYNKDESKSFSYSGLRDKNNNISKNVVFEDMKKSLSKMIKDDTESYEFKSTILKIEKLYEILKIAIPSLRKIGLGISTQCIQNLSNYNSNNKIEIYENILIQTNYTKEELRNYSPQEISNLKIPYESIEDIHFLDENYEKVDLSSGQEIFTYMIFAILGKIEKESLLLFDEPESYLHPNIEVVFMRLLKEILKIFNSYAIIATHSLIITRETPSKFVRVFDINNREPLIFTPSKMETFGGNLNTICNYTFNNILEDKPFEDWLKSKFSTTSNIEEILSNYKDKLNSETLMYIRNEILND